jgi:hypothetical protein
MHAFEVGWYALGPRGDSHGIIKAQSGAGSTGTIFIGRYLEAWKYSEHRSICNRLCVSCRVVWLSRYSTPGVLVVRKPARGSLPDSELHNVCFHLADEFTERERPSALRDRMQECRSPHGDSAVQCETRNADLNVEGGSASPLDAGQLLGLPLELKDTFVECILKRLAIVV